MHLAQKNIVKMVKEGLRLLTLSKYDKQSANKMMSKPRKPYEQPKIIRCVLGFKMIM